MGQTLSEPVVEKISDNGQDERVAFGISAMQGWRISMEDAHAAILDLQSDSANNEATAASADDRISFFGVYDGHGGERVAQFTGKNMHNIIANQKAFKKKDYEQALKDGFLATDRAILSDPEYQEEVSGCTASVGIISSTTIYVANAGDSRSVLGVKGRAKPLSYDHKPQNDGEKARISAAGGYVDFGRVNGNLALSRAIGDFEFKKGADLSPEQQIVTAFPDVIAHTMSDDDEFLVIACDGIWDCQSSQAVVEFVRRGIAAKQELSKICENMMDNCLASNSEAGGIGCDNMTILIVALLRGKSKEQWYQDVADRVANEDGPCAPPEYAEFRGPGVHHQKADSGDDYESEGADNDSGRIIYLGDGADILTDGEPGNEAEDEDAAGNSSDQQRSFLRLQMGQPRQSDSSGDDDAPTTASLSTAAVSDAEKGSMRQQDTPSSTQEAVPDPNLKSIPESALPDKLVSTPPKQR